MQRHPQHPSDSSGSPGEPAPPRARLDWLRLLLEFVIVVAGISLSFWLQDLRQAAGERAEERRYLEGLQRDLQTDRARLSRTAVGFGRMLEQLDWTFDSGAEVGAGGELAPGKDSEDVDRAMDALLTYMGFASSRATYRELQQTGGSKLIRDKVLLAEVIGLYERTLPAATEWDEINRSYVLDRMFPYIAEHGPVVQAEIEGAYAAGYHVVYDALGSEPHFQNLVRTNRMFKTAQKAVYEQMVAEIDRVLTLFPDSLPADLPPTGARQKSD